MHMDPFSILMIASAVLISLLLIVLVIAVFFYYRARRRNKFKPGTVKKKGKASKAPLLMSHDDHNGNVTRVKTETTSTFTTKTQSQRAGPVPATQITVDAAAGPPPMHDHYQQGGVMQLDNKQPSKPAAGTCHSNPKTPKKSKRSHVSSRRQWQRKLMTGREGPAAKQSQKATAESKKEKAERELLASTFANYNALIGEEKHFVPITCHKGSIERDYPVPASEREQLRERKHNILKAYRLKAKSAKKKGKRAQYGTPSKSTGSEVRCVTSNESIETTTGKASTSPISVR